MATSRLSSAQIVDAVVDYSAVSRTVALARAQAGYERVLAGEDPRSGLHQWSFMVQTATLRLWPDVALDASNTVRGGTYNETNDETPLTATFAAFHPYHVGYEITLTDTGAVRIVGYTSSTAVMLDGDQSAVSGETFTVTSGGRYLLPATFNGMGGHPVLTFDSGSGLRPPRLQEVSPEAILNQRRNSDADGTPRRYAVAPASGTDWVSGEAQRFVLFVDPAPDVAWTVSYRHEAVTDALEDATTNYALGPSWMGRLYEAAAMAQSELRDARKGSNWEKMFQRMMVTAIDRDAAVLDTQGPASLADYDDGP